MVLLRPFASHQPREGGRLEQVTGVVAVDVHTYFFITFLPQVADQRKLKV